MQTPAQPPFFNTRNGSEKLVIIYIDVKVAEKQSQKILRA